MNDSLDLRPGPRPRVLRGHPWVFAGEVERLLPAAFDGRAVSLRSAGRRWLGSGIYNSQSKIAWRRFSPVPGVDFDRERIGGLIGRAISLRSGSNCERLVWSDADQVPGLVVDRYYDTLVLQALTRAVDDRLDLVTDLLRELLHPEEIIYRNDAPTRKHEGLDLNVGTASNRSFPPKWFLIDDIKYRLDLQGGNKTGFYLDQRQQHLRVATYAQGRRVLDGFCHEGAFALHCARAGAESVVGVDVSENAVNSARENAKENGLNADFLRANLFDYFSSNRDQEFDLIILDPPSFARNRSAVVGALRGYREINLRALRMLRAGGILATYSCSQNISMEKFESVLTEAAADAHVLVRILDRVSQPPDHPVILNFPESEYLKGMILRVDDRNR